MAENNLVKVLVLLQRVLIQNLIFFPVHLGEVYTTINRIISLPEAWTLLEPDIRRCLVNRFPYGVIYAIDKKKY